MGYTKRKQNNFEYNFVDFELEVYSGYVLISNHPKYNKKRISISIHSLVENVIQIEGKNYEIKSQSLFDKINQLINENLDKLIYYSRIENNSYLDQNAYEGGISRIIKVKCGQLIININGQVHGEIGTFCEWFIEKLKMLIIAEGQEKK